MATITLHPTTARAAISEAYTALEFKELGDFGSMAWVYIQSRPVLDAISAALDELYVALAPGEPPLPIADMAPGELVEAFGK